MKYLICGPGMFAEAKELRDFLASIADLPDEPEVVSARKEAQKALAWRESYDNSISAKS